MLQTNSFIRQVQLYEKLSESLHINWIRYTHALLCRYSWKRWKLYNHNRHVFLFYLYFVTYPIHCQCTIYTGMNEHILFALYFYVCAYLTANQKMVSWHMTKELTAISYRNKMSEGRRPVYKAGIICKHLGHIVWCAYYNFLIIQVRYNSTSENILFLHVRQNVITDNISSTSRC